MYEEWKLIPEWPDYEASNLGRIRRSFSCRRTNGATPGRVLKQALRSRYSTVGFYIDRRQTTVLVHRLVASAFLGPCPEGKEVNHIDGDKLNNKISNLEYVSHSENMKHAIKTGLYKPGVNRGSEHGMSVLAIADVKKIKRLLKQGKSKKWIAELFEVSRSTISHIKAGRTWTHVE